MIPHGTELNRSAQELTSALTDRGELRPPFWWLPLVALLGLCIVLLILSYVHHRSGVQQVAPPRWVTADAIVAVNDPEKPQPVPMFYQLEICLQTGEVRAVLVPAGDVVEVLPLPRSDELKRWEIERNNSAKR